MKAAAVIGLGNIADRHRRNLKSLYPGIKVYAMSASGRKVQNVIDDCDQVVNALPELLNAVDMAIIASPATLHTEHALPFIKAGIPVLIEKPVAVSLSDAEVLLDAAKRFSTVIAVGYCLRYLPSALAVKKLLEEKKAGTIFNAFVEIGQYLPDWRVGKNYKDSVSASKTLGGGALLELSHEFDYTRWLFGELDVLHASVRNYGALDIDAEEIADIVAFSKDNIIINIHLDFLQRKAFRKCNFLGTDGRIEWDLINNQVKIIYKSDKCVVYNEPQYDKNKMYLDMLKDFENYMHGRDNQCITLADAIKTLALVNKIKGTAE
ncbi:Gfo/Idh/MocA family protein [Enterobacter cloacae]|uniref:Gfo/Idh/MocA family protein n=1 Tax=Enterobacter cloacae TaxID=550 RepID=UPI0006690416|nr:Gfo/Idh/MocA family oxidoreductase [Enterobacter cloacae]